MIATMTVSQLAERKGAFAEAVSGAKNTWRIKIIQAGLGSSAYYPAEVIERDGPVAFPVGTKAFIDHPTFDEEWSQPERSVSKIAGKQVSEATYDPTDQALYANYKFTEAHAGFIDEFYDVLGMSIYALGESEIGTIGEYTGTVLTKFVPDVLNSVDVVTAAGAGGAIISKLTESFKRLGEKGTAEPQRTKETKEKSSMDEETFKRILAEALGTQADTIATKLAEALKPAEKTSEAPDIAAVAEAVAKSELPEEGRQRVYEAIKTPGVKVEDVIASEKKYVEAIEKASEAKLQREAFGALGGGASNDDFMVAGIRVGA